MNDTYTPRTAADVEALFMLILGELQGIHPDDLPGDLADAGELIDDEASASTFAQAGLLTNDKGFVLRFANGAEFQVTIVQTDGPEDDDDEENDDA